MRTKKEWYVDIRIIYIEAMIIGSNVYWALVYFVDGMSFSVWKACPHASQTCCDKCEVTSTFCLWIWKTYWIWLVVVWNFQLVCKKNEDSKNLSTKTFRSFRFPLLQSFDLPDDYWSHLMQTYASGGTRNNGKIETELNSPSTFFFQLNLGLKNKFWPKLWLLKIVSRFQWSWKTWRNNTTSLFCSLRYSEILFGGLWLKRVKIIVFFPTFRMNRWKNRWWQKFY